MNIRTRVLAETLSASLAFTLLLSALFFLAAAGIRNTALENADELGDRAALISAEAMEDQVADNMARLAAEWAVILDERLLRIENYTRMTADIAGAIYTNKGAWRPKSLPIVLPGQIAPAEPYLHGAPGADLFRIRTETDLVGNIADILRQITVTDRGITTSAIGGESGYVIAMDAFPWPSEDFEHRSFPWYTGAKEKGNLYWTGVYNDPRGRGPAVSCAMPFYDSSAGRGIFRGAARSTLMLSDLSKLARLSKVGRAGYTFLLDGTGMKLFSAGKTGISIDDSGGVRGENYLESGNPRLRSLALSMTLGASGMTELEMDGASMYVAYAPVQTLGWSLGVAVPVGEIGVPAWRIEEQILDLAGKTRDGINRRIFFFAAAAAAVLTVLLFAVFFLSMRFTSAITGPILALNEGVREVSGGNLEREVSVKTGDELEQLADSFNAMTGRLKEYIRQTARVTAEKERIATELDIAARIQTSILPCDFPPFPNRGNEFDLYAEVYPAKEVGGDFYDFFFTDNDHFAVVMADVSGKGIPAALFMAIAKTLVKSRLQTGETPESALENVNSQLCANNIAGMFVTVWLGVLEISSGKLEYVNAGHNPPLLRRAAAGGFDFLLSKPDLFVAGMTNTVYHRRETVLEAGDILFLYTDGVTEAEDLSGREGADAAGDAGSFYGRERLRQFLEAHANLPPRELSVRLRADIDAFSHYSEQSDDITMLILHVNRAPEGRSITLDADTGRLNELTGFIGGKLKQAACPEIIRGQIELAAEEIFVNIANYAYGGARPCGSCGTCAAGKVTVECETAQIPERMVMTLVFTDRGEAFNPLEHEDPDVHAPLEQRPVGGLGLLIVKRTMDSIEYSYDEEINRLIIRKSWPAFPDSGRADTETLL